MAYRWLIVGVVTVCLLGAAVYTSFQTPLYQSRVDIEILGSYSGAVKDFEVVGESRIARVAGVVNAVQKLRTRSLARRVVYELNLTEQPDFFMPQKKSSLGNIVRRALGQSPGQRTIPQDIAVREERAIRTLLAGLSAANKRQSSIVNITFTHSSPKFTHLVVNQVAESFIELTIDQKVDASRKVRTFVEDQVAITKDQLTQAERALNAYAKTIDFAEVGDEPSLLASRIASVNDALNNTVQERLEMRLIVEQINQGKAVSLPEVIDNKAIQLLKSRIAELQFTYQEKLGVYKPDFPEMVQRRAQIDELQNQLLEEIAIISDSFFIRLQQIEQREESLRSELKRLAENQQDYREKNVEYTILKREVDSKRAQYDSLITRLNAVGIGAELRNAEATILALAVAPNGPFSPRPASNIATGFAIGLILSGAIIYVLQLLGNTFTSPEQVTDELGSPLLGIIPFTEYDDDPTVQSDDLAAFDESYRSLRTAIEFSVLGGKITTLAVTSSEPSEGKSVTAFKLAEGFALLGKKVLLIDADLRRPKLHKWMGRGNTLGLSSLLAGSLSEEEEADLLTPAENENLTFLSAGIIPPNAADLLASEEMARLLKKSLEKFDLVLVDTPPVMGLADALAVTRHTSATVFVVATRQAKRTAVSAALKRLREGGANVVGVALTKFRVAKWDYGTSYSYMQDSYYTYEKERG